MLVTSLQLVIYSVYELILYAPHVMAGVINDVLLACTIGDIGWLKRGIARGIDPDSRTKEVKLTHSLSNKVNFVVLSSRV